MEGSTSFTYDGNGNLTVLDRGRRQSGGGNNVTFFDYDVEGHIVGRADKATALTVADYFQGSDSDPTIVTSYDEVGGSGKMSVQDFLSRLGGGSASSTTHLHNYIYANNKPIAEAAGDLQIAYKLLSLDGGVFVADSIDEAGLINSIRWEIRVEQPDLRYQADGVTIDRPATARALASRGYAGWTELSASAQAKVAAYVEAQLPASVAFGATVRLHGYIVLSDSQLLNTTQITDYSYREIGQANPGGTVQNHVVRSGDTLQSIATVYFGSPAYWYLIADANGLTGSEPLTSGTVLKVPNQVANSVNNAETFKVYNESEIVGSTSPELRTIKKKKKWYQTLIQIVIVVIMIVAAIVTAGAALGAVGAIGTSAGGLLGFGAGLAGAVGAAAGVSISVGAVLTAAAVGAAVFTAASVLTQGLAVAAGLQDKFSWNAVGKAAVQGAVSGAVGAITAGMTEGAGYKPGTFENIAPRVGVEVGRQLAVDGKISNIGGVIGAAAAGGAFGNSLPGGNVFGKGLSMLENKLRGRGDNAMDWVGLATGAALDSERVSGGLYDSSYKLNWDYVALQVVGAAIVGSHRGEDAALAYLGNGIGQGIAESEYGNQRSQQEELTQSAREDARDAAMSNILIEKNARESGSAGLPSAGAFGNALGSSLADPINTPTMSAGAAWKADVENRKATVNPLGLPTHSAMELPTTLLANSTHGNVTSDAPNAYGVSIMRNEPDSPRQFSEAELDALAAGLQRARGVGAARTTLDDFGNPIRNGLPALADNVKKVFSLDNLVSMPTWQIQGAGNPELAAAMAKLQGQRDKETGAWLPYAQEKTGDVLGTIAQVRGISPERAAEDYQTMLDLVNKRELSGYEAGQKRISFNELSPTEDRVPLLSMSVANKLPDNSAHMASIEQLRFGKMVGDALGGLDPVFGALLSPTGGIPGAGNTRVTSGFGLAFAGGREVVTNHGIAHDAAGYLFNYHHHIGPGYQYVPGNPGLLFSTNNPLGGQAAGLTLYNNVHLYGVPTAPPR